MNREIKFRAWTGAIMEYNVMVGFLGAFYAQGMDDKDAACISPYNTKYPGEVPVMQYTGLKDKNGKDIYEGDVVSREETKCNEPSTAFYEVVFGEGRYALKTIKSTIFIGGAICHVLDEIEVIGNIHENPELLKV
jgi:uncharacterized phage protein (TIGR01671 family)